MVCSRYSSEDYAITDPYSISGNALFDFSLTQLSKTLSRTFSSRATLSIYLRWLEVHRREPTKRTEHWQNTLLYWTQSLRSRGFREFEVVAAVEDWKDTNGPFRSRWGRWPPSPKDITKAFDLEMDRTREHARERSRDRDREGGLADRLDRPLEDSYRHHESSGDSPHGAHLYKKEKKKRRQENFEGKPPPNYICNRCGKKGHHLQVCPTNLDPAYDRPPAADYECEICKAVGKHFRSLCPRNFDPYSIIQKRRVQGIYSPEANKGKVFREQKEIEDQKDAERREERRKARMREGRLTQESSNASVASSSPKSSMNDESRVMLEEIEDKRARILKDESVDLDEIMAGSRYDGGGDKNLKISRSDDHYGSSPGGASPAQSDGTPVRKTARTNDTNENTSSPRAEAEKKRGRYRLLSDPEEQRKLFGGAVITRRELEEAQEEAVRMGRERIRIKREEMGRPLTVQEESYAVKTCKPFENGDECPHESTGCPYFHNKEARKAALEGLKYRCQQEEQKLNPDEMNIDESDTEESNSLHDSSENKINPDSLRIDESDADTSEEIDIEVPRHATQYSDFVQNWMQKRAEMSEIVNAVKRRPTAVDMWKLDDQRRMELATEMPDLDELSPPYSPFKSENEEPGPPSRISGPSGAFVKVATLQHTQLDGACGERPVDEKASQRKRSSSENKVCPRRSSTAENRPSIHRKISNIGKEAIEKVKELTTNAVGDFPTFKLRGGSPYRVSSSQTEQLSQTKLRKKATSAKKFDTITSTSEESSNSLWVATASSALKLTEENIKGLARNRRSVSHTSVYSFGSMKVNLPGDRPPKSRKPPASNSFAQYADHQSLEAIQPHRPGDGKSGLQEEYDELPRQMSATSDATELQSNRDDPSKYFASQVASREGKNGGGAGLSDITNASKTKPKEQDDAGNV